MKMDCGAFTRAVTIFLMIELSLEENKRPTCKERRNLMGLEKNTDEYIIVEGYIGKEVQLECHYCNENDEIRRLWYFRDRFFKSPPKEVIQDFSHVDLEERKIIVTEQHTLIIRDFNENDGGIYFCQGYEDNAAKFNYIVDVISEAEPITSIKTSKEVKKFVKDKINPLNKILSKEEPFKIGNSDEVNFKIVLDWSSWGPCKVCNRVVGIKKRLSKCELRPSKEKYNKNSADKKRSGIFQKMKYGIGFSCRSLLLEKLVGPNLVKEIQDLPVIVETDNCAGECKSNIYLHKQTLETLGQLAKEISDSGPGDINVASLELDTQESIIVKVINVTVHEFGQPFHLICPIEIDDQEIIWAKGKTVIKKGKRMEVDILDRLLLKKLDFDDLGEYSCATNQNQTAILKLKLLENHLRLNSSQLIFIWTTFIASVLFIWCCCVTVIYLNHKRVSKDFLRRFSLEDYSNSELKEV